MDSLEDRLWQYDELNDLENIQRTLDDGANPSQAFLGQTAIGTACMRNFPEALELLLIACKNWKSYDSEREARKSSSRDEPMVSGCSDGDSTPDGMDDLIWKYDYLPTQPKLTKEDLSNDEWSELYRYYASVIEATCGMLSDSNCLCDPHCLDTSKRAPIHYAATTGSYKCVELLLRFNAPINTTTDAGCTALHFAVEHPNIVELLLKHKANPNMLTFDEQIAPIHKAAKMGFVETIQLLKEAGASMNITNAADQTALHIAVKHRKYDAAKKLIECGANVNVQDGKSTTPLLTAIVFNDVRMAKILLRNGARLFPSSQHLIFFAIRNGTREMTRLLIESSENVNGRDAMGWTPLLLAIQKHDLDTIDCLLKRGAELNKSDYVLNELHVAIQYSQTFNTFRKLFTILRRHGVDIDSRNKWGESPLYFAFQKKNYRIVEFLVKEGCNLNDNNFVKSGSDYSELMQIESVSIARLLVNAGLNISRKKILLALIDQQNTRELSNQPSVGCEAYFVHVLNNPMTLKQLARIVIRNRIINNAKSSQFVKDFVFTAHFYQPNPVDITHPQHLFSQKSTNSIFKCLIWQLTDLPRILHRYLYAFPDIAPVADCYEEAEIETIEEQQELDNDDDAPDDNDSDNNESDVFSNYLNQIYLSVSQALFGG